MICFMKTVIFRQPQGSLLCICVVLNACSVIPSSNDSGKTLASIDVQYKRAGEKNNESALIPRTEEEIKQAYYDYLNSNASVQSSTRSAVTRLAQMELEISQKLLAETSLDLAADEASVGALSEADRAYINALEKTVQLIKDALEQFPDDPNNDTHLYQLSRSYEQLENAEESVATMQQLVEKYPASRYAAEIHFRLAEYLFADEQYLSAEDAYTESIFAQGNERFAEKALFKRGWSRYKQELYIDAMDDFVESLRANPYRPDKTKAIDERTQQVFAEYFRAFGLAYSRIESEMKLSEYFEGVGEFDYLFDSYQAVVNIYRGQDRYEKAVSTYEDFRELAQIRAEQNPDDARLADELLLADVGLIELYREDEQKFRAVSAMESLLAKTREREAGGLPKDLAAILPQYTATLATYFAQQAMGSSSSSSSIKEQDSYLRARSFYNNLIEDYLPYAKKNNLLAEYAQLEHSAKNYQQAIVLYSEQGFARSLEDLAGANTASNLPDKLASSQTTNLLQLPDALLELPQNGIESALVLNLAASTKALASSIKWLETKVEPAKDLSSLDGQDDADRVQGATESAPTEEFSPAKIAIATAKSILKQYPADRQSVDLTINLAKTLNRQKRYEATIQLLDNASSNSAAGSQSREDQASLSLLLADAYFNQEDYDKSADVYAKLLGVASSVQADTDLNADLSKEKDQDGEIAGKDTTTKPPTSIAGLDRQEVVAVRERLALSYYRKAEELKARAAGSSERDARQLEQTIRLYAAASAIAPESKVAETGLYDAIALAVQNTNWVSVIRYGERYSRLYKQGDYYPEVQKSLSKAFIESDDTDRAAQSLERLAQSGTDESTRAAALWRAAELFEQKRAYRKAAAAYSRYARDFPQPLPQSFEAQHKSIRFMLLRKKQPVEELSQSYNALIKRRDELESFTNSAPNANEASKTRAREIMAGAYIGRANLAIDRYDKVKLVNPIKRTLKEKKELLQSSSRDLGIAASYGFANIASQATHLLGELYLDFSKALLDSERPRDLDDEALDQYEILIEDQAFPFEDQAISFFEQNLARSKSSDLGDWNQSSLRKLKSVFPTRYDRSPLSPNVVVLPAIAQPTKRANED